MLYESISAEKEDTPIFELKDDLLFCHLDELEDYLLDNIFCNFDDNDEEAYDTALEKCNDFVDNLKSLGFEVYKISRYLDAIYIPKGAQLQFDEDGNISSLTINNKQIDIDDEALQPFFDFEYDDLRVKDIIEKVALNMKHLLLCVAGKEKSYIDDFDDAACYIIDEIQYYADRENKWENLARFFDIPRNVNNRSTSSAVLSYMVNRIPASHDGLKSLVDCFNYELGELSPLKIDAYFVLKDYNEKEFNNILESFNYKNKFFKDDTFNISLNEDDEDEEAGNIESGEHWFRVTVDDGSRIASVIVKAPTEEDAIDIANSSEYYDKYSNANKEFWNVVATVDQMYDWGSPEYCRCFDVECLDDDCDLNEDFEEDQILSKEKRIVRSFKDRLNSLFYSGYDSYSQNRLTTTGNDTYRLYYGDSSKYTENNLQQQYAEKLLSLGATHIKNAKREKAYYFTLDTTELAKEVEDDEAAAEAEYTAELNAIDIDRYKPKQAVLDKLSARRASGGHENVGAIYRARNFDKLFTYYYAAAIIGWKELKNAIEDCLSYTDEEEYSDLFAAIDKRVAADASKADTRSTDLIKFQNMFRNVANYLASNNINFTFTSRRPNGNECQKDARNGRCWTLGYRLYLPDSDTTIDFCCHTSESADGGDYGWGYHGFAGDYRKKDIEGMIMNDIERAITT